MKFFISIAPLAFRLIIVAMVVFMVKEAVAPLEELSIVLENMLF